MALETFIGVVGLVIGAFGALFIVYGAMIAIVELFARETRIRERSYHDIRGVFTTRILIGLEFFVAADVLKTYADMVQVDGTTLRVRCERVPVQPAAYTDEELRQAREIVARNGENTPFYDQVKAYRILDLVACQGQPFDMEVQVFALGTDIAWVALPGEDFVELGRSIKAASPFRQTHIVELSNGWTPYIPHRSAYCEGAYEVISSQCAAGTGEQLVGAAIKLLCELHGQVPDHKPAS